MRDRHPSRVHALGGAVMRRALASASLIAFGAIAQVPQATISAAPTAVVVASRTPPNSAAPPPAVTGHLARINLGKQATPGPGYITLLFGRSMYSIADNNCNQLAGSVPLDQVAQDLSSRGLSATGVVVVGRTQVSSRLCYAGSLYPTWSDLDNLRDTYGWSFGSDGMTHNDITKMTPSQQYEESCVSLAYLAENGMTAADAFYAYGDNLRTTTIQTSTVSTCYDYGRTYNSGVNSRATLAAPWFQNTNSLLGGACNDATQPCYNLSVGGKRYPSPASISSLIQVTADQWVVIQFYRMVTGASLHTTPSWDCTNPNWQEHWTSQTEMYCINDFDQVLSSIPAGAVVTGPATVAAAWGRQVSNIVGQVTASSNGLPVAGATVTWSGGSATTDANGYYTLANVSAATQSVSVTAPGEPPATASVQVSTGGTALQNFSLGASVTPGVISGTVTDDSGAPINGAAVTCTCATSGVDTGSDGAYAFNGVAPGTYSMTFTASGFATEPVSGVVVSSANDTVEDATLAQPGTITGTVTDGTAGGGAPVIGAKVTCTCQGGSTTTDSIGHYEFDGLAPGDYSVTFAAAAYVTETIPGVIVTAGTTTPQDASLVEDGSVTGTVTSSATSAPIAGATVTCTCKAGSVITDGSGAYSINGVSPGAATVTVSAPGFTAANNNVTVVAGAGTVANFPLTPMTHQVVFSDGFERGNLAAWTASKGLGVETGIVHSGSFAAEAGTTNGATFARENLPSTYTTGYARVWFEVVSQTSAINVLRLNNASSSQIAYLYVTPARLLAMTAHKTTITSTTTVTAGVFHELEMAVTVNGASSTTHVWLDGAVVAALSRTVSLTSAPIAQLQIGQVMSGGTYNVVFDDAAFDTSLLP